MKYCLFLVSVIMLVGCSGSRELQKEDISNENEVAYNESFDPLSLNDDDLILPEIDLKDKQAKNNISETNNSDLLNNPKEASGYRVQIIATQDYERAMLLEEEAKNQFSRFNHNAYLVFEAPLYKIRLGDFINRDDAEELKNEAKTYGYREAFIVRTKILLENQNQNQNQNSDF